MEESFKMEGKPENQQNVGPQNNVSLMFIKLFYGAVSFLKENWQVIIALTFSCMVLTSRNIYIYRAIFRGLRIRYKIHSRVLLK